MIRVGLLPDEHVYSAFVRERMLCGQMHINTRRFFEINGIAYHQMHSQLPLNTDLMGIIRRMGLSPEQVLHTQLEHTTVSLWLLSTPLCGAQYTMPNNMAHAGINLDKRWRFCPQCVAADKALYGVSYWHSAHHLCGAKICPIHDQILHTHDELRILPFTLPHHWSDIAEAMTLQLWDVAWQPFIYRVAQTIKADPLWPNRVKAQIRRYLNCESELPLQQKERKRFDQLARQMTADLGQEYMAELFSSSRPDRSLKTNILWATLSGQVGSAKIRHPLFWLTIIFWLRNELSECQHLI
ncbi:TniQ family protein [Shewanella inventionis]|uniref:TniQ domain-containing protein n=1 Tax=Shewanella inventionis TaxID=1738770 RepID=A0ABQ1JTY7_9GAMM|nr:TniQ family protein [Shewanella inventionis]MCL1159823.1 TniQ family protein [Shewanella inventionis]GGB75489.1 hypothetical protein GCM10011607_39750 [Shewanella inventionis]